MLPWTEFAPNIWQKYNKYRKCNIVIFSILCLYNELHFMFLLTQPKTGAAYQLRTTKLKPIKAMRGNLVKILLFVQVKNLNCKSIVSKSEI